MTEEVEPPPEEPVISNEPPENPPGGGAFVAPPPTPPSDIVQFEQELQAKAEADEIARQEEKEQVAQEIAVANDAATKALDALRAGEPLQNEPI